MPLSSAGACGASKHPGLGTEAAAAPWAPGSPALPPAAVKGSGAQGPVTAGMGAMLQSAESHWDGSRMRSLVLLQKPPFPT